MSLPAENTTAVKRGGSGGVAVALAIVLAASAAHAEISKRDMQVLSKSQLIYIATVRKDGKQSKVAPVGFTLSADRNAILIQTGPKTWKAKRIRRGSPVLVWIGSADGPAFIGKAEITSDAAVQKKSLDDFLEKYWQNRLLGIGPSCAKFDNDNRVAIAITPIRDLPGGFASAPGTQPPSLEMPATVPGKAPWKANRPARFSRWQRAFPYLGTLAIFALIFWSIPGAKVSAALRACAGGQILRRLPFSAFYWMIDLLCLTWVWLALAMLVGFFAKAAKRSRPCMDRHRPAAHRRANLCRARPRVTSLRIYLLRPASSLGRHSHK